MSQEKTNENHCYEKQISRSSFSHVGEDDADEDLKAQESGLLD